MDAPQLPVLTTELPWRIESLIAPEPRDPRESRDPAAPIVARFGRTVAVKAKGGRPLNNVCGFSHEDLSRLDEILGFYVVDGLTPRFYLAPAGFSPEVAAALTAAGFVQREFDQAVLYGLPGREPARRRDGWSTPQL